MLFEPVPVPDPERLPRLQRLADLDEPYADSPALDTLFVGALSEAVAWHRAASPFFADLLDRRGFDERSLASVADAARLPAVPAAFFKTHEVLSVPREEVTLTLTSSGTTGQKSQMHFDRFSIGAGQRMVARIFARHGWVTPHTPTNYLLYSYEPRPDSRLGTAFTDVSLCAYAPPGRVVFALRQDGEGKHEFDPFGCLRALTEFAEEGLPVRIFGFPAFLHFTLERMERLGMPPLVLHPESLVFLGGGWKGHADRQVPKSELYGRITRQLGIPDARCRDGYGSVEHSIPYVECHRHRLHVPVWSRVFVRNVRTLEPLPAGEAGFLHFVTPCVTAVPAISVLAGDLAAWHPASACGCGLPTPTFEVLGRAGTSRNRSCAVAAAELLGRSAA